MPFLRHRTFLSFRSKSLPTKPRLIIQNLSSNEERQRSPRVPRSNIWFLLTRCIVRPSTRPEPLSLQPTAILLLCFSRRHSSDRWENEQLGKRINWPNDPKEDKEFPSDYFHVSRSFTNSSKTFVNGENAGFLERRRRFLNIRGILWQRLHALKTNRFFSSSSFLSFFFFSWTRYLESVFSLLRRRRGELSSKGYMFQFEWVNNKRADSLGETETEESFGLGSAVDASARSDLSRVSLTRYNFSYQLRTMSITHLN